MFSFIKVFFYIGLFATVGEQVFAEQLCSSNFLVNRQTNIVYKEFANTVPGKSSETVKNTRDGFYFFDGFKRELDGRTIGEIHYKYTSKSRTIFISDMHIQMKRKRISLILLADIIKKYPETVHIKTSIGLDNYRIFEKEYELVKDTVKALKKTPAYKIRKRLGFSKINLKSIDYDPEDSSLLFTVMRD